MTLLTAHPDTPSAAPVPERWDDSADVVVVGFGGAGVCAAIEAAERGADVLAIDRFVGGGATAISGGVVYAGGGTSIQGQAGIEDDVESMVAYLSLEVGDAVEPETLRRFCEDSRQSLRWLADHGVPFEASLCPVKTSYPSDDYFLYASGNESFAPYRDAARPAPRGHRAKGAGLPGANFYAPLRQAATQAGVRTLLQSRATRLITDGERVVGVEVAEVAPGFAAWRHRMLSWLATKSSAYSPKFARRCRTALARIERSSSTLRRIEARAGVVISTGGFIYNRPMVELFAPNYRAGMPLGTTGCDGSGIRLGQSVGGAVSHMDRVSAWRFINPPEAFVRGVLVDRSGERYSNERLYGAQIGRKMVEEHGAQGVLIIDQALFDEARRQCKRETGIHWFQRAPALINLYLNRRVGQSIDELARSARIDPAGLAATIETYNSAARGEREDPFGKEREYLHELSKPPFYAIDCGLASRRFPCPTLTLGGLVVDERTGQVKDAADIPIPGLYAAGRAAVGICSNDYVSGLSIADCVFSGRRAARAITEAKGSA